MENKPDYKAFLLSDFVEKYEKAFNEKLDTLYFSNQFDTIVEERGELRAFCFLEDIIIQLVPDSEKVSHLQFLREHIKYTKDENGENTIVVKPVSAAKFDNFF